MNESVSIIGSSGTGKSTCAIVDLQREVGRKFIDLFDPQGETGLAFLESLVGRYKRVIVDDLSHLDRVLPVKLLTISQNGNEQERGRENRNHVDDLMDVLGRKANEDLADRPLKGYYVRAALEVYLHLPPEIRARFPLHCITHLFKPWDDYHFYLLDQCTDWNLGMMFKRARTLHEATRLSTFGPAERLLESVLLEPAVMARDQSVTYDFDKLVKEKWVRITIGGRNVSREACRMVMGMRSLETIRYVERNPSPVRMVFEEYANFDLAGQPEIRALNTLRKRGLSMTFISQSPAVDDLLREAIDQNCGVRMAYRCGSYETAQQVAGWLTGLLDSRRVHHETERTISDGYYEQDGRYLTWHRGVRDKHYQSLADQRMELIAQIQNGLRVGERYVNNGRIRREYVPLPKEKFAWSSVLAKRVERWLSEMRQSSLCVSPNLALPSIGGQGRNGRSNGSEPIPQPTSRSSPLANSKAIRRASATSASGRKKGKRNASER